MRQSVLAFAITVAVCWQSQVALAIQFTTVSALLSRTTDRAGLRSAVIAGNYTSRLSDVTRKR